jgi:energy-converting hydrogenase Eha subunit F
VSGPALTFVRRLAAVLAMDALLIAFPLTSWLAAQAVRDLLL